MDSFEAQLLKRKKDGVGATAQPAMTGQTQGAQPEMAMVGRTPTAQPEMAMVGRTPTAQPESTPKAANLASGGTPAPTTFEGMLGDIAKTVTTSRQAPTMEAERVDRAGVRNVAYSGVSGGQPGAISSDTAAQQQALQMARGAAEGTAPSFAEQLLRRQSEQALKQQASAIAGSAANPTAVRQAQNLGAQAQMEAGSQAAALRAQEMAQARGEYAGLATNVRGQDIQQAQANQQAQLTLRSQDIQQAESAMRADMANQGVDLDVLKSNAAAGNAAAQANLEAALRMTGMDDARIANYLNALSVDAQQKQQAAQFGTTMDFQREQAAQQARQFETTTALQREQAAQQARQFEAQLALQKSEADRAQAKAKEDRWWQIGGALLSGAGAVGAAYAGKK